MWVEEDQNEEEWVVDRREIQPEKEDPPAEQQSPEERAQGVHSSMKLMAPGCEFHLLRARQNSHDVKQDVTHCGGRKMSLDTVIMKTNIASMNLGLSSTILEPRTLMTALSAILFIITHISYCLAEFVRFPQNHIVVQLFRTVCTV